MSFEKLKYAVTVFNYLAEKYSMNDAMVALCL